MQVNWVCQCTSTILTEEGRSLETILTFNVIFIYHYSENGEWYSYLAVRVETVGSARSATECKWACYRCATGPGCRYTVSPWHPAPARRRTVAATELLAVTRRIKWRNRMHSAHVAKCEEITMKVRADLHLASLEMRLLVFRELLEPGYGTLILCNILCSERKFHKTRNLFDDGRWAQIYLKLMHCRLSNSWMKRVSFLLTPTVSSYLTQQQHLTYHSQLFTHCMHQRCSAMLLGWYQLIHNAMAEARIAKIYGLCTVW